MQKLIRNIAGTLALALSTFAAAAGPEVKAQTMPVCPASGTTADLSATGSCKGTPDRYEITVYEMGLCTADPLGSGNYDSTTCTPTFTSAGGTMANLAGGASVTLGGSGSGGGARPADGSYGWAYVIIGNQFGLRGEYELTAGSGFAGVYGSDSSGTAVNGGTPTNFTETLTNFDPSGACTPTAWENVGTGRLDAAITDSSLTTATSCTGVTRIVGSFAPSTPIVIDPATTGIQVTFSVTNNGMTLTDGPGGRLMSFESGPFSPSFTILK